MFTALMHRAVRMTPLLKPNRRMLIGGAWLFVIFSLAYLTWVISINWGDPAGLTTLYQTTVDGETYQAWGLAYSGTLGLLLAIAQAVIVAAGVVMSVRRRRRARLIGHGILIAWAGLWLVNLLHLAILDLRLDSFCQASIVMFFFACTVYRAFCGGRFVLIRRSEDERPATGEEITPECVIASDELREITSDQPTVSQPREPDRSRRHRLRAACTRARILGVGARDRARPAARATGKLIASTTRKARNYLREHGVIPAITRSTRA